MGRVTNAEGTMLTRLNFFALIGGLLAPLVSAAAPPVISPIGAPAAGESGVRLRARITCADGVFDARVFWRYAGEKAFRSEPLAAGTEAATFETEIPASPGTPDLEYRVVALNAKSLEEADWPAAHATAKATTAASAPATRKARRKGPHLQVDLTVAAVRAGEQPSVLRSGESLAQGDKVAFGVRLNRSAYVYLAERHSSGGIEILFPNDGIETKNPLPADTAVRVPSRQS